MRKSRKKLITTTSLKKILNESAFNPNLSGPLSIIIEAHLEDPGYLESRAIEMISEGRMAIKENDVATYHDKIQKSIALLAVARISRQQIINQKDG